MNHPGDLDLQMFADDELPAAQTAEIAMHLDRCEQCRSEVATLRATRRAAEEYHSQLKATMPPPPRAWDEWKRLIEEQPSPAGSKHSTEDKRAPAVVSLPIRPDKGMPSARPPITRWVAMAATLFLGAVVLYRLSAPEKVSAAQLLERAMVAERKSNASKPIRRLRIRTGQKSYVRSSAAVLIQDDVRLRDLFQRAKYDWNNPLSAESFAKWRAQLSEKKDEVDRDSQHYRIRTTTPQGPLEQATLVLDAANLHPVRCLFRFETNMTVEVDEASDEPAAIAGGAGAAGPGSDATIARGGAVSLPPPVATTLSPAAQELQLIAALHRLGADLGEPVEWVRDGDRLLVSGPGLTAARKRQIQSALAMIPKVEWRDEEVAPLESRRTARELARSSARRTPGPLASMVESRAAGRLDLEPAIEEALDASDAMLARAHALRLLADRFRPAVESMLSEQEQAALSQIRRNHLLGMQASIERLAALIVIPFSVAEPALPWQTAIQEMFAGAQRADQLLNTAFAATGGDTAANVQALQLALSRLQAQTKSLLERTPGEQP